MTTLPIDYNEPPVLIGGPEPINGKWVGRRAVFDHFRSGILIEPHAWIWLKDGRPVRVDIDMGGTSCVTPGCTTDIIDIQGC